jgi:hypothetical protein
MRKAVMPFVLSVGLIAVCAVPANAASTRAEYVAQVDPICQSFVGPHDNAVRAFLKNEKLLRPVAKHGTLRQFGAQTKRIARSLKRVVGIEANLTNQIATVPPPEADFATVSTWLNYRRQEEALLRSAASILVQFRPDKQYLRKLNQANGADQAGTRTVSGLGFQVCEVII